MRSSAYSKSVTEQTVPSANSIREDSAFEQEERKNKNEKRKIKKEKLEIRNIFFNSSFLISLFSFNLQSKALC